MSFKENSFLDVGDWVFIFVILFLTVWGFFICGGVCGALILMGALASLPVALLIGGIYWIFRRKQCVWMILRSYRMLLFFVVSLSLVQTYATRALQASLKGTGSIHYENH